MAVWGRKDCDDPYAICSKGSSTQYDVSMTIIFALYIDEQALRNLQLDILLISHERETGV